MCNRNCNKVSDILAEGCCGNLLPIPKSDVIRKVQELEQMVQDLQKHLDKAREERSKG